MIVKKTKMSHILEELTSTVSACAKTKNMVLWNDDGHSLKTATLASIGNGKQTFVKSDILMTYPSTPTPCLIFLSSLWSWITAYLFLWGQLPNIRWVTQSSSECWQLNLGLRCDVQGSNQIKSVWRHMLLTQNHNNIVSAGFIIYNKWHPLSFNPGCEWGKTCYFEKKQHKTTFNREKKDGINLGQKSLTKW